VENLFSTQTLHYKTVFGHYRRWCKEVGWQKCWIELLKKHKSSFDLSVVNLDGSHSSCMRGGEEVGYHGRKKHKTTNALYIADKQGLVLAMSTPVAGNHNDLFNIEQTFEELTTMLEDATISVDGLFMNADAGRFAAHIFVFQRFDAENLHKLCHQKQIIANIATHKRNSTDDNGSGIIDEDLYKEKYSIERTNA
jgi:hypothetical protein